MTASERGGGDPRAISLPPSREAGRTNERPRRRRPDGTREEAVLARSRNRRGTTSGTPGTTVIWMSDGARTVELVVGLGDDLLHRLGGELGVLACARTRMTARRRQIDHARMTARRRQTDHARMTARRPIACTPTADRSIARRRRRRTQSPRLGVAAKPTAAEPDPDARRVFGGLFWRSADVSGVCEELIILTANDGGKRSRALGVGWNRNTHRQTPNNNEEENEGTRRSQSLRRASRRPCRRAPRCRRPSPRRASGAGCCAWTRASASRR